MPPVIILSRPSLSQNIGSVARAMMNFGLTELRLIDPRADHLNHDARALSADADNVLEGAKIFNTLPEAAHDLHHLYAATARPRDMIKPVLTPKEATEKVHAQLHSNKRIGFVFGSEKAGLDNEEVAFCQEIMTIPLNPDFSSINLAQSVIITAYEYFQTSSGKLSSKWTEESSDDPIASREELKGFLDHFDETLGLAGYYRHEQKRALMQRNLHNVFTNTPLTHQQVRSLRGVLSSLRHVMDEDKLYFEKEVTDK